MGSDRRPAAGRKAALGVVFGAALLASAAPNAPATAPATAFRAARIGVLVSEDSQPGRQTIEGFKKLLEAQMSISRFETYQLAGDPARATSPLERARQGEFDLLLTLGSMATRAAARASIETPVIACLVLRPSDLGGAPNVTGTVLDFPVETELQWLSQILPRVRHIGVVFSPQNNQERMVAASQVAKKLGLTLHLRPIASPREIPAALESLTKGVDVLWGLADPVVLTPETAEPILLFSFRNRIPFIGLSQAWAKAGALYALERDYYDIGAQCGELAAKALDGNLPSSLPPAYPRKVVYCVNLKTARHMKISLAADLIKGARDAFD